MKFELSYNVNKDIYIDMRKEVLIGDILDVGLDNYGIIYNLYKLQNKEACIDYVQGRGERKFIEKEGYDSCILLFSLSNIWLKTNRRNLFKDIDEYLRQDGVIHLWDIDKNYSRFFKGKIKILLPEDNVKEIIITDFNVFKDSSKESTMKLMKQYFEIIDFMSYDNVYYIKAKKRLKPASDISQIQQKVKGNSEDENSASRNKFKIRSQQFSDKILEGVHRRFKL